MRRVRRKKIFLGQNFLHPVSIDAQRQITRASENLGQAYQLCWSYGLTPGTAPAPHPPFSKKITLKIELEEARTLNVFILKATDTRYLMISKRMGQKRKSKQQRRINLLEIDPLRSPELWKETVLLADGKTDMWNFALTFMRRTEVLLLWSQQFRGKVYIALTIDKCMFDNSKV